MQARRNNPAGPISTVHTHALEKAAQLLGGEQQLASYLGIHLGILRACMQGHARLPVNLFLDVVDLIVDGPHDRHHAPANDEPGSQDSSRPEGDGNG